MSKLVDSIAIGMAINDLKSYVGDVASAVENGVPEYTIVKADTATSGYLASYNLTKDGVITGSTIDIPKDYLVKSASLGTVTAANVPVEGYAVGDKYLDFVINTVDTGAEDAHIYINVSDLIDTYVAGDGIAVAEDNTISIVIDTGNGLVVGSAGLSLDLATATSAGAMSAEDKAKLDAIEEGATKITVDTAITETSTNPVTSAAIQAALDLKLNATDKAAGVQNALTSTVQNIETGETSEEVVYDGSEAKAINITKDTLGIEIITEDEMTALIESILNA